MNLKKEGNLFPKYNCGDRQKKKKKKKKVWQITVIDIPIQTEKKLKESVIPSSFEIHPGKLHLVSRSGNNYLWLGALPPGLNILSTTLESF